MALYDEGHYIAAAEAMRNGLALSNHIAQSLNKYEEALSDIAWELDRSDALKEAIAIYEEILTFSPATSDVFAKLAISYTRDLRFQDAADAIAKATHIDSRNVMTHIAMGYLMASLNKYEEAEANYQKALLLDPDNMMGVIGKSSALIKQGKHIIASEFLESVMDKYSVSFQVYDELGFIRILQENYGEARELFRRSLEIDPDDTRALLGIAKTYSDQSKDDEASIYYQKVLELWPEEPTALEGLAVAELRKKNFSKAIPYLERAVVSNPFRITLYVYLVISQFRTGRFVSMLRSLVLLQHSFSTKEAIIKSSEIYDNYRKT
jgi:tetratricopeptide (TPR) repeat protein